MWVLCAMDIVDFQLDNDMVVFSPKRDMLKTKEKLKGSPTSQAVLRILVPHWFGFAFFLTHLHDKFHWVSFFKWTEIPQNSGPRKIKDSRTSQAVLNI